MCFLHPIFSCFGFWYFGNFSCVIFFLFFFLSCPSCLAKCKERLRIWTYFVLYFQQQRPLTRYLPIRNENFDLRAHIESAGHQTDLCSQVILTPDACRGYLHKLSGNHQNTSAAVKSFRSKWNKRWFVFDRHKRAIIYYSDKSETKAKGGVYFQVSLQSCA